MTYVKLLIFHSLLDSLVLPHGDRNVLDQIHARKILARSHKITRGNLAILSDWVDAEPAISWTKPASGTTALLKYDLDAPSRDLCIDLLKKTGVMLLPGSALEMEGYLRIGYANTPSILQEGLKRFSDYLVAYSANAAVSRVS